MLVAAAAGGAMLVSQAQARTSRGITVYSVATGVQFINSADDRARGAVNNPLDPAANKLQPKVANDTGNGPYAGDVALYRLKLFAGPTLEKSAGTAVYTCYFNYTRHALCQAYYLLKGGNLVASGPIDFNKTGYTIVITGGTKKYVGSRGQVVVVPAPRNSQRVRLDLLT
jgi:hypothetical protein